MEREGWVVVGQVTEAQEQAMMSGNELSDGVVQCSEWLVVVYLHWDQCWLCGQLHHSYMQHEYSLDGKRILPVSPQPAEWRAWDGN